MESCVMQPQASSEEKALISIKTFPQIERFQALKDDKHRALYARLTNNAFCFKMINRRYIKAFRKMTLASLTPVAERVLNDLRINGIAFADFTEFFNQDFFNIIEKSFYHFLDLFEQETKHDKIKKGKSSYLDTIHKFHTFMINDPVSLYIATPLFITIASHYLQMICRFSGTSFWRTREAKGEERIYSQQWHRDYNDRALIKVFLYVTDVGEKEGYLEYITGSQGSGKWGKMFDKIGSDGYRVYPDNVIVENMLKDIPTIKLNTIPKNLRFGSQAPWHNKVTAIQCQAPKGTLIFADTFGLHRGGFVEAGHRDMIMTTYSTHFNVHKPQFAVTRKFASGLEPFLQMALGII